MAEFKYLNQKGQLKSFNGYLCEGTELNVLHNIFKIVNTGKSVVIYFFSDKIAEYGYENFEQEKEDIEYFCDRQLHYRFADIAENYNETKIIGVIDGDFYWVNFNDGSRMAKLYNKELNNYYILVYNPDKEELTLMDKNHNKIGANVDITDNIDYIIIDLESKIKYCESSKIELMV